MPEPQESATFPAWHHPRCATGTEPLKAKGKRVAGVAGGVAPIGHPSPLRTIVDINLANFDELVRITGGTAADVGA